jgi:hypothetical protein
MFEHDLIAEPLTLWRVVRQLKRPYDKAEMIIDEQMNIGT